MTVIEAMMQVPRHLCYHANAIKPMLSHQCADATMLVLSCLCHNEHAITPTLSRSHNSPILSAGFYNRASSELNLLAVSSKLSAPGSKRVQQPCIRFLRLLQRHATCFGQRSFAEELEQLCYMRRLELAQLLRLRRQAFLPTTAQEQGKGSVGERTSRKLSWGHTTKSCQK